jgi:hypothetical protein
MSRTGLRAARSTRDIVGNWLGVERSIDFADGMKAGRAGRRRRQLPT